jgi:3-dehydroquinate synthase
MSDSIHARFAVNYDHQVHFTRNAFQPGNPLLAKILASQPSARVPRVLFVVDAHVTEANAGLASAIQAYFAGREGQFELVRDMVSVPGGEAAKNSEEAVRQIYAAIERNGLCRHCYVVAIGGGALLDVAGFAAATAHRGIRHIRMPSTLLGQNDAGVGVKNGINWFGKKNFVGTFAPPFAVINDFKLLNTLPDREKRAGYIEAIKVALIRDAEFFAAIERDQASLRQFNPAAMEELIRRCAAAHVRHIATGGDPFELGSARPLDFGHWAAHKLEQISGFRVHHGEAVAIGIALDVIYSELAGHLDATSVERILALIEGLGFKLWAPELDLRDTNGVPTVIRGLEEFREHLGGALTVTLLKGIGQGFEVNAMDTANILQAMNRLSERSLTKS